MTALVLLLDIGSAGVRAALTRGAEILWQESALLPFQSELELERFLAGVVETLKTVVESAAAKGDGPPAEIVVALGAPFYAAQIQTLERRAETDFVVSEKLIRELVAQGLAGIQAQENEILESSVLTILTNGYAVLDPDGQKVKTLTLKHYASAAPTKILTRLGAVLAARWPGVRPRWHSLTFVTFRALDILDPQATDYLLFDFGGETSELSLVWRDSLKASVSFPLGQNWLARQLSSALHLGPPALESVLTLWRGKPPSPTGPSGTPGGLTPEAERALTDAARGARAGWFQIFHQALRQVSEGAIIPERLYLLGDAPTVPLVAEWLASEPVPSLVRQHPGFKLKLLSSPLLVLKTFYDKILSKRD